MGMSRSEWQRVKWRHKSAGKNRGRPKNIYSDNFHVELLCFTRLLSKICAFMIDSAISKQRVDSRSGWK
jgi:hypothetical protein